MKKYLYLFFAVFLSACSSFGDGGTQDDQIESTSADQGSPFSDNTGYNGDPTLSLGNTDPYAYLNILRRSAGLVDFARNTVLEKAAGNHASYIQKNGYAVGHDETFGTNGFTGKSPGDRVAYVGYRSQIVGEGISIGQSSVEAIDNLMSAIYHRFTLLDISFDEVGMGFTTLGKDNNVFVHNVGNNEINQICQAASDISEINYYTGACEPDFHVSATVIDAANNNVIQQNPQMILWPPPGSNDIPPAFFEEQPDPLPDYSVSGYPVSVQFNKGKVSSALVSQILLFDIAENAYVDNTRMMSKETDPNENFTALDFALFPLQRLAWGHTYRVEAEYTVDGTYKQVQWSFTTRELNGSLVSIAPDESTAVVKNGVKTFLYFEPSDGTDTIKEYKSFFPNNAQLQVSAKDQNTLEISYTGQAGDVIDLTLNSQRTIKITLI